MLNWHSMNKMMSCITARALAALVALPFSVLAMETGGGQNLGIAILSLVWCVIIGITCKNEMTRRGE